MMKLVKAAVAALLLLGAPALAQVSQLASGTLLGNSTGARAPAAQTSVPSLFDRALCSTQGAVITRTNTSWICLSPGTAGLPLLSGGAGANVGYAILGLSGGGTGANLTASNGGIVYSGASAFGILAGTSTAGQMLQSGATASPAWSTATWPATASQGDLLYGSASNIWTALGKNASATRYLANTGTSNSPAWDQVNLTNGVTGALPIGNGGTGQTSLTAHAVVLGNGTSPVDVATIGTSGRLFMDLGSAANPAFQTIQQIAANIPVPKILRYAALSGLTFFTPDAATTLIEVWVQGGGGAGSGNNAGNVIPYSQYGGRGTPAVFGERTYTATISNASPGIITATGSNALCNQPFYLTTTGTLPNPYAVSTVYYVQCGNDGYPAPTANAFAGSTSQFPAPLTCAVYAPVCQTPINTTTAGSGVHTLHLLRGADAGNGGGIVGDQAVPGAYFDCDAVGPSGYKQSVGVGGATGDNIYGINVAAGSGGAGPWGGAGTGGTAGDNLTGGGGSGANPTSTSSGGGGGASGGWCYMALKPTGSPIPMFGGTGGVAGVAGSVAISAITVAAPAVITATAHGFGPNAIVQLQGAGSVLTGLSKNLNYYVYGPTITNDTFSVSTSPNGVPVTTTGGAFVGPVNVVSGTAGGAGAHGQIITKQSYGLN